MTANQLLIRRGIAGAIDYGIFGLFLFAYMKLFGNIRPDGLVEIVGLRHFIAIVGVWLLLFPVLERWQGYTLGKGLLDLKVVTEQGRRINLSQAIKRHLLDAVDMATMLAVAISNRQSASLKRLGDYWANTKVVSDE